MYETHYRLARRPFTDSVDPTIYVPLPGHEIVLRRLRYALEQSRGPAALYGPTGSGKTLLARRLASQSRGPVVHVTFPALPAAELVGWLAEELGEPAPPAATLGHALRLLRARMSALALQDRRPLLVVDDAQAIRDPAVFEALRLLLNFATDGSPDLSLLLVGGTEFLLDLAPELADRLAARCLTGPLDESESFAYVIGRLAAAGAGDPSSLFTRDALSLLHRESAGLPRRLNRLADLALLIAYARELPVVDPATIVIAAREFPHDGIAA